MAGSNPRSVSPSLDFPDVMPIEVFTVVATDGGSRAAVARVGGRKGSFLDTRVVTWPQPSAGNVRNKATVSGVRPQPTVHREMRPCQHIDFVPRYALSFFFGATSNPKSST